MFSKIRFYDCIVFFCYSLYIYSLIQVVCYIGYLVQPAMWSFVSSGRQIKSSHLTKTWLAVWVCIVYYDKLEKTWLWMSEQTYYEFKLWLSVLLAYRFRSLVLGLEKMFNWAYHRPKKMCRNWSVLFSIQNTIQKISIPLLTAHVGFIIVEVSMLTFKCVFLLLFWDGDGGWGMGGGVEIQPTLWTLSG